MVLVGCAPAMPIPDLPLQDQKLSGSERDALRQKLDELDGAIQQTSPDVFVRLLPPADTQSIDDLRESLGGVQNDYLELWFSWHNGSTGGSAGLLPLGSAITSAEAIADRDMTRSVPGAMAHRRRDIKLLEDAAGDGFFLDLSSATGEVYYEMLEDPFPRSYGSFAEFLDFLHAVHSAGIAQINPRGVVVFDEAAYQSLETEHFAKIDGE